MELNLIKDKQRINKPLRLIVRMPQWATDRKLIMPFFQNQRSNQNTKHKVSKEERKRLGQGEHSVHF